MSNNLISSRPAKEVKSKSAAFDETATPPAEKDRLLVAQDNEETNVEFEDETDRARFLEQLEQERIARRKRLLMAARANALALPPLPVLPPDVDYWWKEQELLSSQIRDPEVERSRLPPELRDLAQHYRTIGRLPGMMQQQSKLEPWRLFPPVPQISFGGKTQQNQQNGANAAGGTVTEEFIKQSGKGPVDLVSVLSQKALGVNLEHAAVQAMDEQAVLAMFNTPLEASLMQQGHQQMMMQQQQQYLNFGGGAGGGRGGYRGGGRGRGGDGSMMMQQNPYRGRGMMGGGSYYNGAGRGGYNNNNNFSAPQMMNDFQESYAPPPGFAPPAGFAPPPSLGQYQQQQPPQQQQQQETGGNFNML